uniref:Translocon-associated protein subunit delta n=1 Tax=Acartia pacifica TaxID=335913 RepID=A0A0U2TFW7_ACAPC|nr:translocon-associated protein subunit delta [Acartia pacifica]ALS04229.1 translocon-associated protein subunit delta [Acartia pacifica]
MLRFCLAVSCLVAVAAGACTNPKVSASSYTPADSQVLAAIPFIAEFTLECGNNEKPALFADINGALVPVTTSLDGAKYQVSWVKTLKEAAKGEFTVPLYDSESYAQLKRAMDKGEDASGVAPLVSIVISYPGSYSGPLFNSEHFALFLSAAVFYLAFSSKSKLLA